MISPSGSPGATPGPAPRGRRGQLPGVGGGDDDLGPRPLWPGAAWRAGRSAAPAPARCPGAGQPKAGRGRPRAAGSRCPPGCRMPRCPRAAVRAGGASPPGCSPARLARRPGRPCPSAGRPGWGNRRGQRPGGHRRGAARRQPGGGTELIQALAVVPGVTQAARRRAAPGSRLAMVHRGPRRRRRPVLRR